MSERQEAAAWLRGKAAKKILSELYGEAAFRTQAERYARLADLTDDDAPASELRFYSAPGRTELGGNHTDHNKGRVLCAAVRLDAVACATPVKGLRVSLRSEGYADPIVVDLSDLEPRAKERGKTEALVRGVAKALSLRGVEPRGFVGRIHSEVLRGSGLSSSAAVEVLLGAIMADMAGVEISAIELAKAGQFAENEYFGKPCGLMDQTASAVGGVVAIDFADPTAPKVKRVDFDFEDEGYCLAVVDTGGSHADLTSDYAAIPTEMKAVAAVLGAGALREIDPELLISRGPEIRRSCGDRALLRALHFVAENARV
ncbi:MAG: galactokinase family protein, partial [Spirochaetaceae bacterium]|nr:galactokinase family protein [Spirochaetaceae bacterium]